MYLKKYLIPFFLLFCINAFSQNSYSLEEAVKYSLENNRTIKNADLEFEKAKKTIAEVVAIGLPKLKATTTYTNNPALPVTLIPAEFVGGQKGEFAEARFGTEHNINAGLRLDQLIFDGTYLVGLQTNKFYKTFEQDNKEKKYSLVKKDLVNAYTNVLLAEENAKILAKNVTNLEKNVVETRKLHEQGFVEVENVEQLELNLENLKYRLVHANKMINVAKNLLKIYMGIPSEEEITLTNTLEEILVNTLPEKTESGTSIDLNLDNNIDIRIAKTNEVLQNLNYKKEITAFLPSLGAFANVGYLGNSDSFDFFSNDNAWSIFASVGLQINVPIFDGGRKFASAQKFKLNYLQAKNDLIETEKRVALQLEETHSNYQLAVSDYYTKKKSLTLAEKINKKSETKFYEGMQSSFEFRQAQQQLYTSQSEYLISIINVITEKTNLQTILNTL